MMTDIKKPAKIDKIISEKSASIDKQLEEVMRLREEQKKAWTYIKIEMMKRGCSNEEIEEVKSKYIKKDLSTEVNKLRSRSFYYRDGRSYHRAYYLENRETIIEKCHQRKNKKKEQKQFWGK